MIAVRRAVSDADLAAWRRVFMIVVPNERVASVAEMRASDGADVLRLLAEVDGEVVGSGYAGPSSLTGLASVIPRVVPAARRRGVGTELLKVLARHAETLGVSVANANADDPGSLAFALRFGFHEHDRQIEQVRTVVPGVEPDPAVPAGIEIVTVSQRPELWREAYTHVGRQAFQDMALDRPLQVSLEEWERDWISAPEAMFLALADGQIIGCAGLMLDADQPGRAENALTAVRRDWRHRGVATALKRTTLTWAAANNLQEVYTWTQQGNKDMRRLNEYVGYTTRAECINVRAALPLEI